MTKIFRGILGVLIGLFLISIITELVELLTVSFLNGIALSDIFAPERIAQMETAMRESTSSSPIVADYFATRNSLPVGIFKLLYTITSGVLGGYVAAWIAKYQPVKYAIILAAIQSISLVWAIFFSGFGHWTPLWIWIGLIITLPLGIVWGGKIRARKQKLI